MDKPHLTHGLLGLGRSDLKFNLRLETFVWQLHGLEILVAEIQAPRMTLYSILMAAANYIVP